MTALKKCFLVLPLAAILCGCAGWARHGVQMRPPRKLKVAVLPVEEAVSIKKLKYVMTVSSSAKPPADEGAAVEAELGRVREALTAELEARLAETYFYEVLPSTAVRAAMDEAGICVSTCPLNGERAAALGRRLGADVLLSSRLSGYGQVKKKWITLMLLSGLVEGGVQGIVAAKLVHNTWVAIGVAAEEVAQEAVTWWGGSFLFGKAFSPVVLEGELRSASDGKVVWSKTALATLDKKELKKFPPDEQGKKELRLKITAESAVTELVKSLQKKTARNMP